MHYELKDKIKEKSISLEKYGMNDLAWSKEDAQTLINAVMHDKIGILGGDVYKLTPNHLTPLYDNWSCECTENESEKEYHLRSKIKALKYIEDYQVHTGENIFFSITFTES